MLEDQSVESALIDDFACLIPYAIFAFGVVVGCLISVFVLV